MSEISFASSENTDSHPQYSIVPLEKLKGTEWTTKAIHDYFGRPYRTSGENGTDPELVKIEKFKRFGRGARFLLQCVFRHPKTATLVKQWVAHSFLIGNPKYCEKLQELNFDMNKMRNMAFGYQDDPEWSDGVEEFEDGPDLSLDGGKRKSGHKPKSRSSSKSKPKRYPVFSVDILQPKYVQDAKPATNEIPDDNLPAIELDVDVCV